MNRWALLWAAGWLVEAVSLVIALRANHTLRRLLSSAREEVTAHRADVLRITQDRDELVSANAARVMREQAGQVAAEPWHGPPFVAHATRRAAEAAAGRRIDLCGSRSGDIDANQPHERYCTFALGHQGPHTWEPWDLDPESKRGPAVSRSAT